MKPIKPNEITDAKRESFPDYVIQSFNEMITKNWNGSYSCFKQDDIVELLLSKMPPEGDRKKQRTAIFDNHFLGVEDVYRKEGWIVEYDKPGYNETYPATFTFRKKKHEY